VSVSEAAKSLLVGSLSEQAQDMRARESKCRGAYRQPGPLREASQRLADVYASAAELFEQALAELDFGTLDPDRYATMPRPPELAALAPGPCHPECLAAGMKLAFLHDAAEPEPEPERDP
jgi:hypothetical protein